MSCKSFAVYTVSISLTLLSCCCLLITRCNASIFPAIWSPVRSRSLLLCFRFLFDDCWVRSPTIMSQDMSQFKYGLKLCQMSLVQTTLQLQECEWTEHDNNTCHLTIVRSSHSPILPPCASTTHIRLELSSEGLLLHSRREEQSIAG